LQYDLAESTWMVEEANAVQRNWQHHSEWSSLRSKSRNRTRTPHVCSVLILSFPPKHCSTTYVYIAQVSSSLPRSDSNFTMQYFKSNTFDWFCKQICQLDSSVYEFYSAVVIKVSCFHVELAHLTSFEILWYCGLLVRLMQLALSNYSIGILMAMPNNSSDRRHFNHTKYLVRTLAALISASIIERNVGFRFRLVLDIVPSANVAKMPVVVRLVSLTHAKSALLKHVRQNL
jgi:hypothetical protein